jgi:hypothetical protein
MVRKIVQWIPITALLLALTWRPSANYQILLPMVCAGAVVMVILALFFIKHEIETHYAVDNSPNPARRVTVKL